MTKTNIRRIAAFPVSPKSRRDLESIAEGYLRAIYPRNLVVPTRLDVEGLLDRLEAPFNMKFGVGYLEPGEEGYTDWKTRTIILDNKVYEALQEGEARARQTGCHEVGHIEHVDQVQRRFRDGGPQLARHLNSEVPIYCDAEWQAKGVGAALLMPRSTTPAVFQRGGLAAVIEVFQVSSQSAQIRIEVLRELRLI